MPSRQATRPPSHSSLDVATAPMQRVHTREPFIRGFGRTVRELIQYHELLGQLIRKELKVKYKNSVLGFLWTLVRPLLQLLVYSIAIGILLGASRNIPAFGLYMFTGLLAWTLFTDILGGSTGSIVGNSGLITKVYLPTELFPLAVIGAALVNFSLQCVILVGAWAFTRRFPDPTQLPLIPLALLVIIAFGAALGLMLAAMNVYLRDVSYLVDVGLLLWFWMTPIIYDWTKVHDKFFGTPTGGHMVNGRLVGAHLVGGHPHLIWLYNIYLANPMANVVLAFQRAFWPQGKGTAYYYGGDLYLRLAVCLAVCLALLWFAQRFFARHRGNFAQEL